MCVARATSQQREADGYEVTAFRTSSYRPMATPGGAAGAWRQHDPAFSCRTNGGVRMRGTFAA